MKAWHFVGGTLRDGRPVPNDGEKLVYTGALQLCESGLHASREPFDALQYAPGSVLCLVECGGKIIESDDKFVCAERTIIARMEASEVLRYYARMQALSVIELYPNGIDDAVFDYLMTGENAQAAAAARAADAAARAAWSAATWSAAARAAAAAARAADAARAARAARAEFNALVYECFEEAA